MLLFVTFGDFDVGGCRWECYCRLEGMRKSVISFDKNFGFCFLLMLKEREEKKVTKVIPIRILGLSSFISDDEMT